MAFIDRSESKNPAEKRMSVWYLSELLQWSKLGLLPARNNMDIEYYCSFLGAYEIASCFQGVATLVHGPSGCVESFNSTRVYPGDSKRFKPKSLSTDMQLNDVIYGASDKLSKAILNVDEKLNPFLILILTNCCADIIGENISAVANKLSGRVKADIINIETGGCSGYGFRKGADRVFEILFDHVADKRNCLEKNPEPTINLFTKRISGRPAEVKEIEELSRLLGKIGVKLNTVIRLGTHYDDLLRIPLAKVNATLCYLFGDGPMQYLNKLFGQPYAKVTFPIGLRGTLDWIKGIAKILEIDSNRLINDPEVELYHKKIEEAQRKYRGREAFIWMPGEKGLAMARFAAELGMKPYLFSMSYFAVEELRDTIDFLLEDGYDFPAVLTGKQDIMLAYNDRSPSEMPILFMPKKFWTGELPTTTVNFFADPILGFKGIDYLLTSIGKAASTAGKKDYSLFNRFVESRFDAVRWDMEGPAIKGLETTTPFRRQP
ncbi:MAG: nitrogenase component 1 [Nitrospirota bacterium]